MTFAWPTHILVTPRLARPWWATHERFEGVPAGRKVWTDCCACKVPADETESRIVTSYDHPHGGLGCYQEPPASWDRTPGGRKSRARWAKPDYPTGAYYDPVIETRCAPGCGCDANPRKRWGMGLRQMMRDGC